MAADGSASTVPEGRVPPHDMDAEAAVLSAVMLDPHALDDLVDLEPRHFYSESHRRIFEAAVELRAARQPVDVVTVGGWLKDRGRIAQVGGMSYLTELLNAAPAVANVGPYGRRVRDLWRVRQFIATAKRAAALGYLEPSVELIEKHAADVAKIADDQAVDALVPIATAMSEAYNESLLETPTGVTGTRTGLEDLDVLITGMHEGENIVVAGRPGMGKSALVFGAGLNVAREGGGVCALSLEMPRLQVAQRLAASLAGLDLRRLRLRRFTEDERRRWTDASSDVGRLPIMIDDTAGATLRHMRAKVRRAEREFARRKVKLKLVIVDYLQLASHPQASSREQEVSEISRGMKALAKDFGCTVVALSQLNRGVETRSDKRPTMADLRESGAIEQDADAIVLLFREDYYDKKTKRPGVAELIVAKQRNGPTGTVFAGWSARSASFHTLSMPERIAAGLADASDDVVPGPAPAPAAPKARGAAASTPASRAARDDDPEPPAGFFDDFLKGDPPT